MFAQLDEQSWATPCSWPRGENLHWANGRVTSPGVRLPVCIESHMAENVFTQHRATPWAPQNPPPSHRFFPASIHAVPADIRPISGSAVDVTKWAMWPPLRSRHHASELNAQSLQCNRADGSLLRARARRRRGILHQVQTGSTGSVRRRTPSCPGRLPRTAWGALFHFLVSEIEGSGWSRIDERRAATCISCNAPLAMCQRKPAKDTR